MRTYSGRKKGSVGGGGERAGRRQGSRQDRPAPNTKWRLIHGCLDEWRAGRGMKGSSLLQRTDAPAGNAGVRALAWPRGGT